MKKTLYFFLVGLMALMLLYNLVFDFDWFAALVNLGAITGLVVLPRLK